MMFKNNLTNKIYENTKHQNGFTLVELLATLIILSVFALIITPIIINQIESAKKNSFIVSAKNTIDATKQYVGKGHFIPNNGLDVRQMELKNKEIVSGLVFLNREDEYLLKNFTDGSYCASGSKNDLFIWKSYDCASNIGLEPSLKLIIGEVTTNSILVNADAKDDLGIKEYAYCIEECNLDKNWYKTKKSEFKFSNLKHDSTYEIAVRVTNRIDYSTEKTISSKTKALPVANYQVSPSGWARAKTIVIQYPNNYDNYIIVHSGIAKQNGQIIPQGEKRKVTEKKQTIAFETNGTIEAITSDGYNEASPSTLTVSQIDTNPPINVGVKEGIITSKSIQAIALGTDVDSGIKKYEFSINNGEWIDNGTSNVYTFNNLKTGSYDIKVRLSDYVNLQAESSGQIKTNSIVPPTYSLNPTGWVKNKTVTIHYENGYTNQFQVVSGSASYKGNLVTNNTWITTTENNPDILFQSNGSIEARSTDSINTVTSSALTISQIDTTPPVINGAQIRSSVSGYNAVTTILDSNVVDNSNGAMEMYLSNTGYENNGTWEPYNATKNWNVGGTLDGGSRKVYITYRDLSGNKTNQTLNYTVYKECSSNTSVSYGGFGSCNKSCGGGTQTRTVTTKDNATGKTCSITTQNQSCNTQGCTLYRYRTKTPVVENRQFSNPKKGQVYQSINCTCSGSGYSVPKGGGSIVGGYYLPGAPGYTDSVIVYGYKSRPSGCSPSSYKMCPMPKSCFNMPYTFICSATSVAFCNSDDDDYISTADGPKCVKYSYSCPAGTTLNGSTCYSEWSGWSYNYVASSATVEVETKQA